MRYVRLFVPPSSALAILFAACCLQASTEDAGRGTSTGSGSISGTAGTGGSASTSGGTGAGTSGSGDGGTACWVVPSGSNGAGAPGPGISFCGSCGFDQASCQQLICPACSKADGAILLGPSQGSGAPFEYLDGLCGGLPFDACSVAQLECLKEGGPKVLSPNCAAAVATVVEQDPEIDGGSACYVLGPGVGNGNDFCSAVGSCVGGTAHCEEAICNDCGAVDGLALGGDGGDFFGGLCPAPSPADPCADFACIADAGSKVVSPGCAAALASLAARYLDGGLDGG